MPFTNTATSVSDLAKGYRKTATKLYTAFKRTNEEYSWADEMPDEEITPSGRENLIPLDVRRGYGAAMIGDGGYEARTITPAMAEGSFSFVHSNARFFISRFAQAFDQKARSQQIIRQLKYQSMKCFEAVSRRYSLQFYGFTTGIVCDTSTNATAASGQAYTLEDAFGVSTLDNAAYLASLFEVGDGVALVRAGALVANGLGTITAKSAATPSITVTWDGSVDADANDSFVFANAVTDATITASDYGRWPVGLLDAITTASVHGLSSATEPNWAAALNDTAGGRFSFVKLKKMKQALYNQGDATLTHLLMSNGVQNDVEAGERSARIYSSSMMDLDGEVKAKGVKILTSALVPPGEVIGWDKSAIAKKILTEKPAEDGLIDFGDLYKAEDRSGWKGGLDLIHARIIRNRAGIARYGSLTEQ
jgi:hypothetical protein